MALHKIPVLPADYPLFDWADWPESRAALVERGPTNAFQMACWNAIVTHLAEALEAAGEEWYTGEDNAGNYGYTAEQTKITDGILYADKMNRMISNTYGRIPLQTWLWAYDTSYRGYTGMVYFNKHAHQIVYPEYITELVWRINQMIEIMRGTWPIVDLTMATKNVRLSINPGVRSGRSMDVNHKFTTRTGFRAKPLEVIQSIPIVSENKIRSNISSAAIRQGQAGMMSMRRLQSKISMRFDGEMILANWLDIKPAASFAWANALIECLIMMETGGMCVTHTSALTDLSLAPSRVTEAWNESLTSAQTMIVPVPPIVTAAQVTMGSLISADSGIVQSINFAAQERTKSSLEVEILPGNPQYVDLTENSHTESEAALRIVPKQELELSRITKSGYQTGLVSQTAIPIASDYRSKSEQKLTVIKSTPRPTWAEQKVETLGTCKIVSAWDQPIRKDDGLWIRQVRTAKVRPDGSLDLSGSGDPIAAKEISRITAITVLHTAWLPPVRREDGLYIPQVRGVKVMEDGSLDLTGAGYEMAVRQGSGTHLSAALDTGWYPPVVVGDGLYLRQVYDDPVQNENGELEVW